MKTIQAIILIIFVSQIYTQEDPSFEENQKEFAFKTQCRIKQRGTFDLAVVKDKDYERQVLVENSEKLTQQIAAFPNKDINTEEFTAMETLLTTNQAALEEYDANVKTQEETLTEAVTTANTALTDAQTAFPAGTEDPDGSLSKAVADATKAQNAANVALQQWQNGRNSDKGIQLFMDDDNNTVELPALCQDRLSSQQLLQLGTQAVTMKNNWIVAAGLVAPGAAPAAKKNKKNKKSKNHRFSKLITTDFQNQVTYTDDNDPTTVQVSSAMLPPLNQENFWKFYVTLTSAAPFAQQEGAIYPSADDTENADLQIQAFQAALFNKNRAFITWLEFWVYMCNDGQEPKPTDYMVPVEELNMEDVNTTYGIVATTLYAQDPTAIATPVVSTSAQVARRKSHKRAGHRFIQQRRLKSKRLAHHRK